MYMHGEVVVKNVRSRLAYHLRQRGRPIARQQLGLLQLYKQLNIAVGLNMATKTEIALQARLAKRSKYSEAEYLSIGLLK
jgi:hypothetical protein